MTYLDLTPSSGQRFQSVQNMILPTGGLAGMAGGSGRAGAADVADALTIAWGAVLAATVCGPRPVARLIYRVQGPGSSLSAAAVCRSTTRYCRCYFDLARSTVNAFGERCSKPSASVHSMLAGGVIPYCGVLRRSYLGAWNVVSRAYRAVMNDSFRFDVVVTIATDGSGLLPDPDRFVAAARRAALSRAPASQLMFAYTARKVITSMTLAGLPDESAAVSAALDVVSEAFRLAVPSRRRDWGAFDKPVGGCDDKHRDIGP
jgi:hypothetical protein